MGDEVEERPPDKGDAAEQDDGGNKWRYPIAGLVIGVMVGLVAYVTITTGHIPLEVALPLIAGASAAVFGFRLSDWRGK